MNSSNVCTKCNGLGVVTYSQKEMNTPCICPVCMGRGRIFSSYEFGYPLFIENALQPERLEAVRAG